MQIRKKFVPVSETIREMKEIYERLDAGEAPLVIASSLGISVSTLYRWHHNYQKNCRQQGDFIRRDFFAGRKKQTKIIDMEKVYERLDAGETVKEVAASLGVSRTTLYARHRHYQTAAEFFHADDLPDDPDLADDDFPPD